MHQSITPSLSQTIWPRWVSRQFVTLPIVQTLLPVTFGYSLSSRYETIEEMKEAVKMVIDKVTQEDVHEVFQEVLERHNKCIAAGGDYFVCTINKNGHTKNKSGNLFNDPRVYIYIYIYIYVCVCVCVCVWVCVFHFIRKFHFITKCYPAEKQSN